MKETEALLYPAATPESADLVARVHAIGDILRLNGPKGDANRRVVESSIEALDEAGLFQLATPRRYGGLEASMKTIVDVCSAVGEYDGGTAWVVSLITACNWIAGLMPVKAQDDVWGANPNARVAGVFSPSAEAVRVEGGYRVTGKWFYNSGSWHADWAALGFPVPAEDGEAPGFGFGLFPMSELELQDTWFTVGMRASGSNCLIAENVFVPEHRVLSATEANEGRNRNEYLDEETLYRSAFQPLLVLILVAPQLGMARFALNYVRELASKRAVHGTKYKRQTDSVAVQLRMARASMMIDTAHLHAYRAADDIDAAARARIYPDLYTRARIQADCSWSVENVRQAIDSLITAHGAGSFAESNPLQRVWRDSNTAGRHAYIMPDTRYEVFGKALLGADDTVVAMV